MTVNKTQEDLSRVLDQKVNQMERQLLALKTIQPIGFESVYTETVLGSYSTTLAAAAMDVHVDEDLLPDADVARDMITLWTLLFSVRVDVDDIDHNWPNGASLTSAQRKLRVNYFSNMDDIEHLSDDKAQSNLTIVLQNRDSSSHTYYVSYAWGKTNPSVPVDRFLI